MVKAIPKFWPVALVNHGLLSFQTQHNVDRNALSYLEDLWVTRDPKEPRCFTLEFVRKVSCYVRFLSDMSIVLQTEPLLHGRSLEEGVQIHRASSCCR